MNSDQHGNRPRNRGDRRGDRGHGSSRGGYSDRDFRGHSHSRGHPNENSAERRGDLRLPPLLAERKAEFLSGIGTPPTTEFKVDTFQTEAINNVVQGRDTLVVAPTGSGKTYIALESIRQTVAAGKKAVYTTPLKALSNTKFADFKARFEPEFRVGLLTGDRKIDGDAQIVIATTEIYRNELYQGEGRFSLVVLDEVHYIADAQRGAVWEESIILTPQNSTLLMLSASISNPSEIASWLSDVRGKPCEVVLKKDRPVELRFGFLHPDLGVIPLTTNKGELLHEVVKYYDQNEGRQDSRGDWRGGGRGGQGGRGSGGGHFRGRSGSRSGRGR